MGMGMDQKHSNTHFEIWRHPSASSLYHGISWDIMGKALWHDTPTTKEVSAHGSTQGNSWYVRV